MKDSNSMYMVKLFEVETDHMPLVAIMSKPLNDCPRRIQRMMIRLQKYNVNMTYTPGKYMFAADTLSRAVDKNDSADETTQIQAYVDRIVSSLPVSEERTEQIRKETETDQTMRTLKETIQRGWPEQRQTCPAAIQDYWMCRTELTVVDGIIFKGNKFVIPPAMRQEILLKIHEGHLGEEKCKRRARKVMYWPRINTDISRTTASCEIGLTYRPKVVPNELIMDHSFQAVSLMHSLKSGVFATTRQAQTTPGQMDLQRVQLRSSKD